MFKADSFCKLKCHNYYNYHLSEIILSLSVILNQTSGHMNIQLSVNELVFIKNSCFTCMINVSSIFTWVINVFSSVILLLSFRNST